LTRIIEKRQALHRSLAKQQEESKDLQSQNVQLQALANLGSATSMIAHEINNLLTPLANYAALAVLHPDDKELVAKALSKTVSGCQQVSKVMLSMLAMANGQAQKQEPAGMKAMVDQVFNCLCRDFKKDGITVHCLIPEDLTVVCVPVQIQQVLMNLILNAREAMLPGGGTLKIVAEDEKSGIHLTVSDTGKGIARENIENIFKQFFTTKTRKSDAVANSGSGVGLAFCKRIVDAHQGEISVTSQLGQGTTFRVRLPKQR
jgi:two-component system, NtrC family, sensor kinase